MHTQARACTHHTCRAGVTQHLVQPVHLLVPCLDQCLQLGYAGAQGAHIAVKATCSLVGLAGLACPGAGEGGGGAFESQGWGRGGQADGWVQVNQGWGRGGQAVG